MLVERRAESGRKEWYEVGVGMAGHSGKALGVKPRVSQRLEVRRVGWVRGQVHSESEGRAAVGGGRAWVEEGRGAPQGQEALTPGWIRSQNQSG